MAKAKAVAKTETKAPETVAKPDSLFKEMLGFLTGNISKQAFETKVVFTPWFSNKKGTSGLVIDFGSELQYQIQVSGRDDGKVMITTNFAEFCKPFNKTVAVVSKEAKKI